MLETDTWWSTVVVKHLKVFSPCLITIPNRHQLSNLQHCFLSSRYIYIYIYTYIRKKEKICLTSASARNSESQRHDASSLIFQLMYT